MTKEVLQRGDHTILVEDMKFKNRDGAFSAFVTIDQTTGRPNYTRHNPENRRNLYPQGDMQRAADTRG